MLYLFICIICICICIIISCMFIKKSRNYHNQCIEYVLRYEAEVRFSTECKSKIKSLQLENLKLKEQLEQQISDSLLFTDGV